MKKAIFTLFIFAAALFCTAQNDSISNVSATQRTDGSGQVDVYFSLAGQGVAYDITQVEVSFNAGSTYETILPIYLSGDTSGLLPGDSLHIVWDGMATHPDIYNTQTKLRLTAIEDCGCPPTIADSDGNVYNTVLIGDQCWMAENLKTGMMINAENNQSDNDQIEKYCFDNNPANCETYGGLYQWNEALQYANQAGTQGICPSGWHIPTDAEWCTLTQFIDETVVCSEPQWSGTDVGTRMKSETGWDPAGTNTSGFTALSGGAFFTEYFDNSGFTTLSGGAFFTDYFAKLGNAAYYWSSVESDANNAWVRHLDSINDNVGRSPFNKIDGYSVRCLKNANPQAELPAVSTESVTEITYNSATSGGNVTDNGGGDITALGVVWSTISDPTIESNEGLTNEGVGEGEFVSYLTELLPDALYYIKAYATNSAGTAYGEQLTFTTLSGLATLTTNPVIEITDITAVSGGNITDVVGGAEVIDRGCVWSTEENPSLENYEGLSNDGEGIGEYVSYLTNLNIETLYYVRAYATSDAGTAYGQQRSFTTLAESFIPTLTTDTVTAITWTTATSGGNITDDGGADVVDRGCVWSTTENPTVENYEGISNDGEGIGEFVSYLTELLQDTTYYVRAYATNVLGTGYGQQEQFTTAFSCGTNTITDIDGNVYNTVLVNDQCWMKENLATTQYRNGTAINYPGDDGNAWANDTEGAYGWYDNDIIWKDDYGAHYNWYAAVNTNGLCPTGWHVPDTTEMDALIDYLGGNDVAGGELKSTRTDPDEHPRWNSPNIGATNESNWTAYPIGYRIMSGFFGFGESAQFHVSDDAYPGGTICCYEMYRANPVINKVGPMIAPPNFGFGVRCIKDE